MSKVRIIDIIVTRAKNFSTDSGADSLRQLRLPPPSKDGGLDRVKIATPNEAPVLCGSYHAERAFTSSRPQYNYYQISKRNLHHHSKFYTLTDMPPRAAQIRMKGREKADATTPPSAKALSPSRGWLLWQFQILWENLLRHSAFCILHCLLISLPHLGGKAFVKKSTAAVSCTRKASWQW